LGCQTIAAQTEAGDHRIKGACEQPQFVLAGGLNFDIEFPLLYLGHCPCQMLNRLREQASKEKGKQHGNQLAQSGIHQNILAQRKERC